MDAMKSQSCHSALIRNIMMIIEHSLRQGVVLFLMLCIWLSVIIMTKSRKKKLNSGKHSDILLPVTKNRSTRTCKSTNSIQLLISPVYLAKSLVSIKIMSLYLQESGLTLNLATINLKVEFASKS